MRRKRRHPSKAKTSYSSQGRKIDSHLQAFANIEHELKSACHTLNKHARPNVNMFTFARDTQKVMLLMAELRYLINECKTAQNLQKRKKAKNYKSKSNKRRRKAA